MAKNNDVDEVVEDTLETKPEVEHVLAPKNTAPDDFYGKDDSCYIRVQHFAEGDNFRFEVKNETLSKYNSPEKVPESLMALSFFVRGMLECALSQPHGMYQIGRRAAEADMQRIMSEDMTQTQKDLLNAIPEGNA